MLAKKNPRNRNGIYQDDNATIVRRRNDGLRYFDLAIAVADANQWERRIRLVSLAYELFYIGPHAIEEVVGAEIRT
jgi:hypothetical protein